MKKLTVTAAALVPFLMAACEKPNLGPKVLHTNLEACYEMCQARFEQCNNVGTYCGDARLQCRKRCYEKYVK